MVRGDKGARSGFDSTPPPGFLQPPGMICAMDDRESVPPGLRTAAAYGWRIIVLLALAYILLQLIAKLELVAICIFVALIVTALAKPIMKLARKVMPKVPAAIASLLILFAVVLAILGFITGSVAGEWDGLLEQFRGGVGEIEHWLADGPMHVATTDIVAWYDNARTWLVEHRGELATRALGGAGTFAEGLAGFALSIFTAVCFLVGGDGIWAWILRLFPRRVRARVDGAGAVAWRSFAGYTRGIIIVAAVNAVFVAILLLALRIPLAIPLALLVFFGTFVPLIGAPLAMVVATVVALGTRGPWYAIGVIIGIFLLGQLEGHVLQPVVMSRTVSIHPLAVALALTAGTIIAGIVGAIVAVPVVSVIYGVAKFWIQTAPHPIEELPEIIETGGAS